MRIIKFRGKRLENGEWIFGDLIENQGRFFIYHATNETTIEDSDNGRISIVAVEVDPSTVGQYTELNDKDGKEIYEGDIVEVSYSYPGLETVGRIKYQDGEYLLAKGEKYFGPIPAFANGDWTVAGNIHDNPDLLRNE